MIDSTSIISCFVTDTLEKNLSSSNPADQKGWFKSLSLSFPKSLSRMRLHDSFWNVVNECVSACMMEENGAWSRRMSHEFTSGVFTNEFVLTIQHPRECNFFYGPKIHEWRDTLYQFAGTLHALPVRKRAYAYVTVFDGETEASTIEGGVCLRYLAGLLVSQYW